jgi:hypothetical protein
MSLFSLLPAISGKRPGRVVLGVSMATRALYIVLGAALVLTLIRDPAGGPFAVMFALVIALAALSEDSWIFDKDAGEMRRRTGVLFLAKSWAIDLETIASIELDAEFEGADAGDPYGKVSTSSGKNTCAIRLVMADGKTLVMCSAKAKRLGELRERAQAIAETIGLTLVES